MGAFVQVWLLDCRENGSMKIANNDRKIMAKSMTVENQHYIHEEM
jgi:hypothetical protein